MQFNFHNLLVLLTGLCLWIAGCGSSSSPSNSSQSFVSGVGDPGTGSFSLVFQKTSPPPGVDAVQYIFKDAQGSIVGGPIELPISNNIHSDGVPITTTTVEVDYLRNGGYALFHSQHQVDLTDGPDVLAQGQIADETVVDPDVGPHPASTSDWTTSMIGGKAHLNVSIEGGEPEDFLVKGVCYSPAPIGYNTREAPDLGDFFWDSPEPDNFMNWRLLWKTEIDGNGDLRGRPDVESIRDRGMNTIRVYNFMPYHLNLDGTIPDPNNPGFTYKHTTFLDECWNNGDDPIFVLVGIAMPDQIWYKETFDNQSTDAFIASIIRFWDAALPAQVEEVANHPAVLGFVIFNEKAFPQYYSDSDPGGRGQPEHWWNQVKKYSERTKQLAPDKLVGWATNDDPQIPVKAKGYIASHGQSLDFFGVNGYQPSSWSDSLDNYLESNLGDLARPVIVTEFGMPSTTRTNKDTFQPFSEPALTACKNLIAQALNLNPNQVEIPPGTDLNLRFPTADSVGSVMEDEEVRIRAGAIVARMIGLAFEHPVCVGVTYFDWCDEYWKQESYGAFHVPNEKVPDPNARRPAFCVELSPTKQEGGMPAGDQFPGGYWDEEGFGLHSIEVDPKRQPHMNYADKIWKPAGNTYPDLHTPRAEHLKGLTDAYNNAEVTRARVQ